MRFAIYILALCSLLACKQEEVVHVPFFDRLADSTTHTKVFGPSITFCNDSLAGYDYYSLEVQKFKSRTSNKIRLVEIVPIENMILPSTFWNGKVFLKNGCLYTQNTDNPQPYLLLPFIPKGYTDTIRNQIYLEYEDGKEAYPLKHFVSVEDVFFDERYNDTIYKIKYNFNVDHTVRHSVQYDNKTLFVGKHVGLVGVANAPLWNPDKNKYILYGRIGNYYPEKYNYDTTRYIFE